MAVRTFLRLPNHDAAVMAVVGFFAHIIISFIHAARCVGSLWLAAGLWDRLRNEARALFSNDAEVRAAKDHLEHPEK